MQIAALVLVSALIGAGGVVVKDEVQEARRQEILLADVAGQQRLAAMELNFFRARVEEANAEFERGLVTEETLRDARLALREVEIRLTSLHLDEEEIRQSGREPNNDLSAPLVGGRDFVTLRMNLRAGILAEHLEVARAQLDRVQELHRGALAGEREVTNAQLAVRQVESEILELQARMELRERVEEGSLDGETAEREVELTGIRMELTGLVRVREALLSQVEREWRLARDGLTSESQLREVRFQLMRVDTRLELLRLKLEILEEGRSDG